MKRIIYSAAIAALLVTSCQKTDVLNVVEDAIEFGTEVGKLTKTPNYDINDPKYGTLVGQGFRVWAVADYISGTIEKGDIYDGIEGIGVQYKDAWGFTDGKHLWPSNNQFLYFYMISSKHNVSMNEAKEDWLTQIKNQNYFNNATVTSVDLPVYTIKADAKIVDETKNKVDAITFAGNDIMVADRIRQDKSGNMVDGKVDKSVRPYFRHTMTKVEFNFVNGNTATDVILKSITTSPLNNEGKLTINYSTFDETSQTLVPEDAGLFAWNDQNGEVPFTKTTSEIVTYVNANGAIVESVESATDLDKIENPKNGDLRVLYGSDKTIIYKYGAVEDNALSAWYVDETEDTYTTINGTVLTSTSTNFVTWYMIPQSLTGVTTDVNNNGKVSDEGTVVTIEYVAGGKDITQKFSLAVEGVTEDWAKETCVRYNVTIAPHKIVFVPNVTPWRPEKDETLNN